MNITLDNVHVVTMHTEKGKSWHCLDGEKIDPQGVADWYHGLDRDAMVFDMTFSPHTFGDGLFWHDVSSLLANHQDPNNYIPGLYIEYKRKAKLPDANGKPRPREVRMAWISATAWYPDKIPYVVKDGDTIRQLVAKTSWLTSQFGGDATLRDTLANTVWTAAKPKDGATLKAGPPSLEREIYMGAVIDMPPVAPLNQRQFIAGPLYQYDINASYIFELAGEIPTRYQGATSMAPNIAGVRELRAEGFVVCGRAHIKAGAPDIFPVRIPEYPSPVHPLAGGFSTMLWDVEMLQDGGQWVEKITDAHIYDRGVNVFQEFTDAVWGAKSQWDPQTQTGDFLLAQLAKKIYLACTGKFASRAYCGWYRYSRDTDADPWAIKRELRRCHPSAPCHSVLCIDSDPPHDYLAWVIHDGTGEFRMPVEVMPEASCDMRTGAIRAKQTPGYYPAVISYVTAKARVRMRDTKALLERHGWQVVRMHTDSVLVKPREGVVPTPVADIPGMDVDPKQLGAWKYEESETWKFEHGILREGLSSYQCLDAVGNALPEILDPISGRKIKVGKGTVDDGEGAAFCEHCSGSINYDSDGKRRDYQSMVARAVELTLECADPLHIKNARWLEELTPAQKIGRRWPWHLQGKKRRELEKLAELAAATMPQHASESPETPLTGEI